LVFTKHSLRRIILVWFVIISKKVLYNLHIITFIRTSFANISFILSTFIRTYLRKFCEYAPRMGISRTSCNHLMLIIMTRGPQWPMEQHTFKNINNCLNTNIYSYLETSGGHSSNPYLNVVHFFNTRVN